MTMERNGWEQLQDWIPDWLKASLGGDYTALMERPEYAGIREKLGLTDTPSMEPEADPSFQAYNDLMKWLQQLSPEDQARTLRDPNSQMFQAAPSGQRWVFKYNEQSGFEEWTLEGGTTEEQGQNQYSIEQMGGWDVQVMRDASGNIIDMQPLDQTPTGAGGGEGWSPYEQARPGIEQGYLDLERQKMGQMNAYQKAQMGVQQQELGLKERQWQTGLRAQPSSWIEAWFAENQPSQTGDTDLSGNPDYQQYLQETGGGQAGSGMPGGGGVPQVGATPAATEPKTREEMERLFTEQWLPEGWQQTLQTQGRGGTGMEGSMENLVQQRASVNALRQMSGWGGLPSPELERAIIDEQIASLLTTQQENKAWGGAPNLKLQPAMDYLESMKLDPRVETDPRGLNAQIKQALGTANFTPSTPAPTPAAVPMPQPTKQQTWAEDYFKKNPFNI